MQILIPIFLQLVLIMTGFQQTEQTFIPEKTQAVHYEILNTQALPFAFEVTYKERRHQLHVRTENPLASLRIQDVDKKNTSYDVRGSGMVMLPLIDFKAGSYIAEFKFQKDPVVVLLKIDVPAIPDPSTL